MVRAGLILGLISCFLLLSCNSDHDIPQVKDLKVINAFLELKEPHFLNLLQNGEAGRPLFLCLTILEGAEKIPLSKKEVFVYQADAFGNYKTEIPGKETTAKIRGTGITDNKGRLLIRTLLPGDFGSVDFNRNIQIQIEGAQPKYHKIYFRQFANCDIQNRSRMDMESHLVDLNRDEASNLIAFFNLEVNSDKILEHNLSFNHE
jgi:protocatechuate 3,4-dioxygenase beta subunit